MIRRRVPASLAPGQLWRDSRKIRFLVVGGWNTVFGYLCFYVLYALTANHLHYLIIAILAHVINVIQAYAMQRKLVFRSSANIAHEFLRFNASLVATFLFNLLAMFLLVEAASLKPLVAQAVAIVLSLVVTYALHSFWSFRLPATMREPPE